MTSHITVLDDDTKSIATHTTTTTSTTHARYPDVEKMPFDLLCGKLERLKDRKPSEKKEMMTQLWKSCGLEQDLYPLMRLLLPQLDHERATYGLRESTIADTYIQVLGLNKTSEHAQRLKNYKVPRGQGRDVSVGDFTVILHDVIARYARVPDGKGTLTIRDINDMLDQLARLPEKSEKRPIFSDLLSRGSARENFWFARIIIKDLRIGMKHESMLKLFHPRALDLYNSCSNLKTVCALVADPARMKKELGTIQVMQPFKPMLCSAPFWKDVLKLLKGQKFVIEDKYDGERLLIHKKGLTVKLFTRNSIDYTHRYGYGAAFIPIVLCALNGINCIIDGEMLTWSKSTQTYLRFGSNRTTAMQVPGEDEDHQLCFKAFDLLMLDDTVLIDQPLEKRRALLERNVVNIENRFEVVKQCRDASTTVDIMTKLDEALFNGMEGIIVKVWQSKYGLNERSNNWIKIKPDYVDGIRDNLDLIILGGYFGEGTRRAGDISHFLLGVAAPFDREKGEYPKDFYAFCKVGSGYSFDQLTSLRQALDKKWKPYDPKNQPTHFMGWKHERSDQPDYWIKPEDSVIIELKCYEITTCRRNKFHAEYTTRFPRVAEIRYDKEWFECMTITDVIQLYESRENQQHNFRSLAEGADGDGGEWGLAGEDHGRGMRGRKKKVSKKEKKQKQAVMSLFRGADVSNVEVESDLFAGKTFCVMSAPYNPNKFQLETLIKKFGGAFIQNPLPGIYCILAKEQDTIKTEVQKQKGAYDIIHYQWLLDSIEQSRCVPYTKSYILYATPATREMLEREVDIYGDSFTIDATIASLRECCSQVRKQCAHPYVVYQQQQIHAIPRVKQEGASNNNSNSNTNNSNSNNSHNVQAYTTGTHPKPDVEMDSKDDDDVIITGTSNRGHGVKRRTSVKQEFIPESSWTSLPVPLTAPISYTSVLSLFDDAEQVALDIHNMFRRYDCYLDRYMVLGDLASRITDTRLDTTQVALQLYGATISDTLHPGITHVIFNDDTSLLSGFGGGLSRLTTIRDEFATMRNTSERGWKDKYYVRCEWVRDSIQQQQVAEPRNYPPRPNHRESYKSDTPAKSTTSHTKVKQEPMQVDEMENKYDEQQPTKRIKTEPHTARDHHHPHPHHHSSSTSTSSRESSSRSHHNHHHHSGSRSSDAHHSPNRSTRHDHDHERERRK